MGGGTCCGKTLVKLFAQVTQDEHGNEQILSQSWFLGKVEEWNQKSGLYVITYEDGDTENLSVRVALIVSGQKIFSTRERVPSEDSPSHR